MKRAFEITAAGHSLRATWVGPEAEHGRPVLVFLHEALGSIGQWKAFPLDLSAATGLPGLVYERWGFGVSERRGPGPWASDYLEREAESLEDVLTTAGVDRPVLFGHSDGGTIALFYSSLFPKRPEAVIAEAAHVFVEEVTLAGIRDVVTGVGDGRLQRALTRYHGEKTDDVFSGWADTWLAPGFRAWDMTGHLGAIRTPLLVLQGEGDQYGTAAQVEAIRSGTGGPVEARLLPGCGHVPHLEAPGPVLRASREFLGAHGLVPGDTIDDNAISKGELE